MGIFQFTLIAATLLCSLVAGFLSAFAVAVLVYLLGVQLPTATIGFAGER